uniref:Uncharacterized protein n=1 Tax=Chelydra serpentina TaxID=8475 RepID=A0A8C3SU29_CHESE
MAVGQSMGKLFPPPSPVYTGGWLDRRTARHSPRQPLEPRPSPSSRRTWIFPQGLASGFLDLQSPLGPAGAEHGRVHLDPQRGARSSRWRHASASSRGCTITPTRAAGVPRLCSRTPCSTSHSHSAQPRSNGARPRKKLSCPVGGALGAAGLPTGGRLRLAEWRATGSTSWVKKLSAAWARSGSHISPASSSTCIRCTTAWNSPSGLASGSAAPASPDCSMAARRWVGAAGPRAAQPLSGKAGGSHGELPPESGGRTQEAATASRPLAPGSTLSG